MCSICNHQHIIINQNSWRIRKKLNRNIQLALSRNFWFLIHFIFCLHFQSHLSSFNSWNEFSLCVSFARSTCKGNLGRKSHAPCILYKPRRKHIFYHYQIVALLSCGRVPKNLQPKLSDNKTPYGNDRKRNANIKSIL